jgi:hypothetical protein
MEEDGVRFLMADEIGDTVSCRVTHEALRGHAERNNFSGTDGAVFEAYRELIERWRVLARRHVIHLCARDNSRAHPCRLPYQGTARQSGCASRKCDP